MSIVACRAVLALSLLVTGARQLASADQSFTSKLRGLDHQAEALIDEGLWRSKTFQRMVAAVTESDLVVYVSRTAMAATRGGVLRFVGTGANGVRYLLIELNEAIGDDLATASDRVAGIATLAHELQHALEVAASAEVRDSESFDAFFRAIGVGPAADVVDTRAARQAGSQVYFEMTGKRRPH